MNDILIVTVEATIKHGTHANMRINEQNLRLHIINEYMIFETPRKPRVYADLTQLLRYYMPARW